VRCSTSFNSMPSFCRRWIAFGHEARLSGAIEDERYAARVFRRSESVKSISRPCSSTALKRYFQRPRHPACTPHPHAMNWSGSPDIDGSSSRFRGVALNPAEDRGWGNLDAPLGHHLGQIAVADPILAVPAHTQQDDLNRKAARLEQRQRGSSMTSRPSLQGRG